MRVFWITIFEREGAVDLVAKKKIVEREMPPRAILFTDLDGTIVHYPGAQESWGENVSSSPTDEGEGETVLWKEKVN